MPTDTIEDQRNANVPGNPGEGDFAGIAAWIMTKVRDARQIRDDNNKYQWDRYERTYRGIYSTSDKSRESERSKLIAPALTQAIDGTVAAINDAIFGRDQWFDLLDDTVDMQERQTQDIETARTRLKEDMDWAGVPAEITKTILNGALYGTGIGKINVERKRITTIEQTPQGPERRTELRPLVTLTAIAPWEFVIDSNARTPDDAFFCSHEFFMPRHKVWEGQASGKYLSVDVGPAYSNDGTPSPGGVDIIDQDGQNNQDDSAVWITEYYGKVPAEWVRDMEGFDDALVDEQGFVESIVVIANELTILKIRPNPFIGGDRPIVAYQHATIPGRFYGAGVAEKGWNAQKALDAELRARMDALGLLTSPMMGADITRLPRNPDMKVRPGKVWLTRGRPSEVLEPIVLGNLNPNTFNQSAEMERMVQVGTGAIDSNAPLDNNRRNETASGISMIQSSALKRMRVTMWNLERSFLNPFFRKALWRYMQFNPQRYPQDLTFGVKGTMGIVAREFEQAQLTALLSVLSPEHPSYGVVLRGVVELSGSPKRDEMIQALNAAEQPNPQEEAMRQQMQQLQMQAAQLEVAKLQAEIEETQSETLKNREEARKTRIEADLEDDKVEIQAMNAVTGREKTRQAFEQNDVARERNRIQAAQARNRGNNGSGNS